MFKCKLSLFKPFAFLSGALFSTLCQATDITQADSHFFDKNYQAAQAAYTELSQVGNARAFYQLGVMHLDGLGVDKNRLKAILWFDLAADQNFSDAEQVVQDLLAASSEQARPDILKLITHFRQQFGWQQVKQAYFPVIKPQTLTDKIYFGESVNDKSGFYDSRAEALFENSIEHFPDEVSQDAIEADFFSGRPEKMDFLNRAYSAIVDYEVAPDGSTRNLEITQEIGRLHQQVVPNLKEFTTTPPQFNQTKASFISRAFIGLAGQTETFIRKRQENIYIGLNRAVRRLRKDDSLDSQYQLAMALTSFAWLAKDGEDPAALLLTAAEGGHPLAQYELGLNLYREQQDIGKAIYWIGEAAKAGVAKAEYRLANILLTSPWVEKDEDKALFWLQSAIEKSHVAALLSASELSLLANNEKLHNVETAQAYLSQIPEDEQDNPQYEYLQAMVNVKKVPRELSKAVKHLRSAIDLAEDLNWDVSDWQSTLSGWTSDGKVTVVDEPTAKR